MKKIIIILTIILFIFGCSQQSEDYLVKVNGEKINNEQLSIEIDQEIETLESKGIYLTRQDKKEIKEKVLEPLIKKTLLLQEAKKGDYLPSDEEVERLLNKYLDQIPKGQTVEDFYDTTEDQLHENITIELQINNYVIDYAKKNDMEDELTVTDEEIKREFEKFKEHIGAGDHMKLENYYDDVKDVLWEDKLLDLRNKITNQLIEDSEIVYNS